MVSINSALEVDITGQICADSIGPSIPDSAGSTTLLEERQEVKKENL